MQTVIEVKNLSKSYGGIQAAKSINLSVKRGEVFGLLGANGAGKTTTIECILGTRSQDSGSVSILGMNPIQDRRRLFQKVGVQFQESGYQDKITVKEICELTASLYKQPANYKELLTRLSIQDKLLNPVSSLSGGQKQRLFIILALIPNPEVVFLDELTTGLDTKARREVWQYLKHYKEKGLTIFLSSHYMDEIQVLCDRICILKKGEAAFTGTVGDAISSSPFDNLEDAYLYYSDEEAQTDEII